MVRPHYRCSVAHDRRPVAGSDRSVAGRRLRRVRGVRGWVVAPLVVGLASIMFASPAVADPTGDLRVAVDEKRGDCPPLQQDSMLDGVAEQADRETQEYAHMTARFQPMEDPVPLLRQLGYPAGKAKLLSGYSAESQERAIYGAVLFGWDTIPDCAYTRYGAHAMTNPHSGIATAAIVLAGD